MDIECYESLIREVGRGGEGEGIDAEVVSVKRGWGEDCMKRQV